MNIDIHIIMNMKVENSIIYYLLPITHCLCRDEAKKKAAKEKAQKKEALAKEKKQMAKLRANKA